MHDESTNPNIHPLTGDLVHLPLAQVEPSKSNPRLSIDKEPFHELKRSIAQNGLLQPIVVRPHGPAYQIIGGHRRFAAITELAREHPKDERFTRIAAIVKEADDATVAVLQLAENLNRADLAPLEIAEGVAAAVTQGMSKEQLAENLGWQPRKLYRYLQLHGAPAWLKDFAKEVQVPKKRVDEAGAAVVDPVTNAPVHDLEALPGLAFTDVMELVMLHNALHDVDVAELKKSSRADFKPQAERITRKLAYAAASEQWTTARLRCEVKRAKEPPASRTSKKAASKKPGFSVTRDNAFIDFTRAAEFTLDEREQLANELTQALRAIGYAVVIHAPIH